MLKYTFCHVLDLIVTMVTDFFFMIIQNGEDGPDGVDMSSGLYFIIKKDLVM